MLKKITHFVAVAALILGLTQQSYAHFLPCGPYFGLDAGVGQFRTDLNSEFGQNVGENLSMSAAGFAGNLMLGWAFLMNNWYFALDGFAGINTARDDVKSRINLAQDDFVTRDLYHRYQFGAAANLGYMLLNVLLYVRLGLAWSNFKLNRKVIDDGNDVSGTDVNRNAYLFGFMPGIGMAMMLCDCWMLSMLFTYTFYQSHTFRGLEDNAATEFPSERFRPRVAAFTIGLTWFFGPRIGFNGRL